MGKRSTLALGGQSLMAISEKTAHMKEPIASWGAVDAQRSDQEPLSCGRANFAKHEALRGLIRSLDNKSAPVTSESSRLSRYAKAFESAMASCDRASRHYNQTPPPSKVFALAGGKKSRAVRPGDIRSLGEMLATIGETLKSDSGLGASATVESVTPTEQFIDKNESTSSNVPEFLSFSGESLYSLAGKGRPNLQIGILRRLFYDQARKAQRTNLVQEHKFSEQLEDAINKHSNRSPTTAELIAEVVTLSKWSGGHAKRHEDLGLAEDEVVFCDTISMNHASGLERGDDTPKKFAHEVVAAVRARANIDWNLQGSVRAAMRAKVLRLFAKYDFPPYPEEYAVELVIEQAKLIAAGTGRL